MYVINFELCLVQFFEKYLFKRYVGMDRFFLYFKNIFLDDEVVWYWNEFLGVNIMKKFMKNVLKFVGFFREYINYCIRFIIIIFLNYCGFEFCYIVIVSGYRNEFLLFSYCYDILGIVDLLISWDSNILNYFG